jgi:sulfite oxidase
MLGLTADAADEMGFVASAAVIKDLASEFDSYTVKLDGEIEGMEEKVLNVKDMIASFPKKVVVAALIVRHLSQAFPNEPTHHSI